MRFGENELVQGLLVLAASELGEDVEVSVYGGRDNVCGSVRFTFPDPLERASVLHRLQAWADGEEPVTLLARGDTMSLIAERAVLKRALETA